MRSLNLSALILDYHILVCRAGGPFIFGRLPAPGTTIQTRGPDFLIKALYTFSKDN